MSPTANQQDPINLAIIQLRLDPQHNFVSKSNNKLLTSLQCYQSTLLKPTQQQINACLEQAIISHPNNRLIKTKMAKQNLDTQPQEALKKLKQLIELFPQDEALLLILAQTKRNQGLIKEAQHILISNIENKRYKFELYQELSQGYANQQQWAEAYLFEAHAHLELGNFTRTRHLLTQSKIAAQPISDKYHKTQRQLESRIPPQLNR
jgi:predicted Zn-dependent protease